MRLAIALVFIFYLISLIGQPVVSLPIATPSNIAAWDSSRASDLVVRSPAVHLNHFEKRQLGAIFSWLWRGIQWLVKLIQKIHIGHRGGRAAVKATKAGEKARKAEDKAEQEKTKEAEDKAKAERAKARAAEQKAEEAKAAKQRAEEAEKKAKEKEKQAREKALEAAKEAVWKKLNKEAKDEVKEQGKNLTGIGGPLPHHSAMKLFD